MKRWLAILATALACGSLTGLQAADVALIKINGPIGPATASYIARAIDVAGARNNAALVIQLSPITTSLPRLNRRTTTSPNVSSATARLIAFSFGYRIAVHLTSVL
ncbi:MAG: hypothetical protein JWR19_3565 [Pedosphaera sp.]|nr:hypothetical protein [Pedosphaera sp.]